jgi:hypothetical protein
MSEEDRQREQADNDRNHKNLLAVKAHAEMTRTQLREAQDEVKNLRNDVAAANSRMNILEGMVKSILVKVHSGSD